MRRWRPHDRTYVRGIRGAIAVDHNTPEAIGAATKRLLREMVAANGVAVENIASVLFSLTPDLHAQFPALFAREMGWTEVPMLHFCEIDVPGSMSRCIRVLMHVNTALRQKEVRHIYLDAAASLRPDLAPSAS